MIGRRIGRQKSKPGPFGSRTSSRIRAGWGLNLLPSSAPLPPCSSTPLLRHGPDDQQIRPPPPQTVVALHTAAAINDALQKCLHEQLRPGLFVIETLQPRLGVLTEELLERSQQLRQVEPAIRSDVPGRLLGDG